MGEGVADLPDFTDLSLLPDTPALLIPVSDSAIYSSKLPQNENRLTKSLPSTSVRRLISRFRSVEEKCGLEMTSFKLEPSAKTCQYILGSSKAGYIILHTLGEDGCWVNLQHCRIIPHPDEDSVVVKNTSTSVFTAEEWEMPGELSDIQPTHQTTLHSGVWHLTLGIKLDFLLLIFRRPSRCLTGAHLVPAEKLCTVHPQEVKKKINNQRGRRSTLTECGAKKSQPSPADKLSRIISTTRLTKMVRVKQEAGGLAVLKICRKPDLIEAADMWENERRMLSQLKHASVIRLLDFSGPRLTLTLEYMDGQDLSKYADTARKSTLSELDGSTVWRQISDALRYLHSQDIVHNDVKPENIMLRQKVNVVGAAAPASAVLCDFGHATSGPHYPTGGTPCYIAPEFIYDKRGRLGDLWAFGVTMLFVLGFLPLPNRSWKLAEIPEKVQTVRIMTDWLDQIREIRARLPQKMKLLSGMLMEPERRRITAASLCEGLAATARATEKLLLEK